MYSKLRSILLERRRVTTVAIYGAMAVQPRLTAAILAIIYARIFSLGEYGIYGVLSSLVAIFGIIADLGLPTAILRNYYDCHDDHEVALAYLSSVVRGSRLLALVALPIVGIVLFFLWDLAGIGRAQIWYFVPILVAVSYFDRSTEILAAICRAVERPDYFAVGRLVQGIASIAAGIVLVVVMQGGVVGALLAILISRAASSWAYQITLSRGIALTPGRTNWAEVKACLAFSLPLVPNRFAAWLRQSALRPILAHIVPMASVGLFSLAGAIATLPMILSQAVDLGLSPLYFKRRASGTPGFAAKVTDFARILVAVLFPVWVFSIVFCSNIVHTFATGRFMHAVPTCAVLFCAAFARFQHPFLLRQIVFLRTTLVLPLITGACTVLTIVLTLTLTRSYGILVAGSAVALSDVAIMVGLAWAIQRYEHIDYPLWMSLGLLALLAGLAVWVVFGEPVPAGLPKLVIKIAVFLVSMIASFLIWVWPNRDFIRHLARG